MFKGLDYAYNQVKEFHAAFGHQVGEEIKAIPEDVALNRACWTAEEVVEFLYATSNNDMDKFNRLVDCLLNAADYTREKLIQRNDAIENVLVSQMDALTDINYFTQGSFVIAGVKPQPLFDIVQDANMAKLWPDGKPRYREEDGKIVKPEDWVAPEPLLEEEINRQIGEK